LKTNFRFKEAKTYSQDKRSWKYYITKNDGEIWIYCRVESSIFRTSSVFNKKM